MNDPPEIYTYAATSTLPDALGGLFAIHLIGPDCLIRKRGICWRVHRRGKSNSCQLSLIYDGPKLEQKDRVPNISQGGY